MTDLDKRRYFVSDERHIMECWWVPYDSRKPDKSGCYLVLWSEPYSDNMIIKSAHYNAVMKRFSDSPSGANEILFWLDGVDQIPDQPRQGKRTRRLNDNL